MAGKNKELEYLGLGCAWMMGTGACNQGGLQSEGLETLLAAEALGALDEDQDEEKWKFADDKARRVNRWFRRKNRKNRKDPDADF